MEIRNALQKIENYLTVVSNLNRTILTEGTMSRDELLLMKKYLYTSIDRIEDIERSLILDKKSDKSFTPTLPLENTFIPPKEKEIVAVDVNNRELETTLNTEQKSEMEDLTDDVQIKLENKEQEIVGEIKSTNDEEKENPEIVAETKNENVEEITPVTAQIITEDYSLNKSDELVKEKTDEPKVESVPLIESIITEDYSLNKIEENNNQKIETPTEEKIQEVQSIITEDYSLNKIKTTEQHVSTFADEIAASKKEEKSLFQQLEQQLNTEKKPSLFELFDDGKEELHESFLSNKAAVDTETKFDNNFTASTFDQHHEAVLVADEKEVETVVEQLTPSSLNDVFKPQTVSEFSKPSSTKTLSESIALNDKFIFVRELFGNHFGEYEAGLKQLETLNSYVAAESFCKDKLWNKFDWDNKTATVERFMELVEKRFK